jgi:hypothetical protein
VGLQRPSGTSARPVVSRNRVSSVLDLQRTVGNRAVAAVLQRQITDPAVIQSVQSSATQLAGEKIRADDVAAAAQAVIAKHANDTAQTVIDADLRSALAAQHALAALRVALANFTGAPPTFGNDAAQYYAAAGNALAEVGALAADPAKVKAWTTQLAPKTNLHFLVKMRLGTYVEAALSRFTAEAQLAEQMRRQPMLADIPAGQAWKLLMDADKHQTRGAYGFENEPGYMAGMMRGFKLMLEELDKPFTADLYERLHDIAIRGVRQRSGEAFEERYRGDVSSVSFGGVLGKTFTIDGLARLRQANEWTDWFKIDAAEHAAENDEITVRLLKKTREQCEEKVTGIIERYNHQIATAGPEEAKLTAILKCCQDLEVAHTFTDANLRTTAFLILNRLLIQNGLSPTVLGDPNNLDGHTIEQLIPQVRAGQERARTLQLATL